MQWGLILLGLSLFVVLIVLPLNLAVAFEVRTVDLVPLADSFVSSDNPQSNFGKELYLRTEYESQKTVIYATSFDVPPTTNWISVFLPRNGKITGSFTVTEGGNKDINFWITSEARASTEVAYVAEYAVTTSSISFTAPYTGTFYLGFDNSFSWFTHKQVSLSDVVLTMKPFNAICSRIIFLQFDLSSIPPEATINEAKLSLVFKDAGVNTYNLVKAFSCSQSNWNEQSITYENAPFSESYLTESSSLNESGHSVGQSRWDSDIKADVVRSLVNGKLTEIVAVVGGQLPGGMVEFYSRESENKPNLEISYTYVSVSSSLSSTFMIEGQNVAVNAATNPSQNLGSVKIQYSTDQVKWNDVMIHQGGSVYCAWTSVATGQIYVRSVWEVSWSRGSYQTVSPVTSLYVMPIYLVVTIPIIIVVTVAVLGVYYWRKRRAHIKKPATLQTPEMPPPPK
jgi:hypothetical protein